MYGLYKAPFANSSLTGYGEEQTTFWDDFTQTEVRWGKKEIQSLINRCLRYWKNDKIYTTELSMVLNWKSFEWSDRGDTEISNMYSRAWIELDQYVKTHWKGEDLTYYLTKTD